MRAPQPDERDAEYTVDWDSAWQKEIKTREEGTSGWRPEGRAPVSDEQLREARVKKTVDDAQVNLQLATTDWRFWVGILAVLSVGTALLGHTPSGQTYSV